MKRLYITFAFLSLSVLIFCQVPNAFNYQAVVRDASGNLVINQDVSFRISILKGPESSSEDYSETHSVTTNDFGLVNLKIGMGDNKMGIFMPGGWGIGDHFIKIEIDVDGGDSFVHRPDPLSGAPHRRRLWRRQRGRGD